MSTYVETAETKVIFKLQSEDGTGTAFVDRTITLPGQPSTATEARAAWLKKCKDFRAGVLSHFEIVDGITGGQSTKIYSDTIIQPTNWRDKNASSVNVDTPYRAIDVEFELYTVQKQRFTADDFNS